MVHVLKARTWLLKTSEVMEVASSRRTLSRCSLTDAEKVSHVLKAVRCSRHVSASTARTQTWVFALYSQLAVRQKKTCFLAGVACERLIIQKNGEKKNRKNPTGVGNPFTDSHVNSLSNLRIPEFVAQICAISLIRAQRASKLLRVSGVRVRPSGTRRR